MPVRYIHIVGEFDSFLFHDHVFYWMIISQFMDTFCLNKHQDHFHYYFKKLFFYINWLGLVSGVCNQESCLLYLCWILNSYWAIKVDWNSDGKLVFLYRNFLFSDAFEDIDIFFTSYLATCSSNKFQWSKALFYGDETLRFQPKCSTFWNKISKLGSLELLLGLIRRLLHRGLKWGFWVYPSAVKVGFILIVQQQKFGVGAFSTFPIPQDATLRNSEEYP